MSEETPFTPRLGRIRDQGAASGKRARRGLAKTGKRLSKARGESQFTGARYGAGGAARTRGSSTRHLSRSQMRRVIVKIHIARAGKSGPGLYRAHVGYLQRDGVDRGGEGGVLYDRDNSNVNPQKFLERSEKDPHQFRIIVSPQDGARMGDLKKTTRSLMDQMEKDIRRRLDWVAVDHHNTGHPHTHIVIRGRDQRMRDVVIAKNYLTHGLRERAEELVTQTLGPRRTLEIISTRKKEIDQTRWTGLDRAIAKRMEQGHFTPTRVASSGDRFERSLQIARIRHLETLGLAKRVGPMAWELEEGWRKKLERFGRRGDIVRTMSSEFGEREKTIRFLEDRETDAAPVTGVVKSYGAEDELRDRRFMLVEDFDGAIWHVPAAAFDSAAPPPEGAIVELEKTKAKARASDIAIDKVAIVTGGLWSEALHAMHDPRSTPEYRLTLKRRLEALRRAGLTERMRSGDWRIGAAFLEQAAGFESERAGGVKLNVVSYLSPDVQITRLGETWIDRLDEEGAKSSYRLQDLRAKRLEWLRETGVLGAGDAELSSAQRAALRAAELRSEIKAIAARSSKSNVTLEIGDRFRGTLEGHVDLASGRMSLVANSKEFALVPWRDSHARQFGRVLSFQRTRSGVSWTMGGSRGASLVR